MRVLVTGGGGFLGSHVVERLLQRGYQVRVLQRSDAPQLRQKGVELLRGNLADRSMVDSAVAGCEAVFHVAAKAGVWGAEKEFYQANVVGTRNVVDACVSHSVQRLIYTSTPSVVFTGESFAGADESLPYGQNWLCHYAATKAQAEAYALAADAPGGLRVCALRPHLIWGIGDPHLLPRVLKQARKGRLRRVGEGLNKVDITHVRNAADAHLLAFDALGEGKCGGKAYFLSQGEPVVLWSWIDQLLAACGEPLPTRTVSAQSAHRIGMIAEAIWRIFRLPGEPPMTRFVAVELSKDHWYSIAAARRDFGYAPENNPTDAALVEYAEHYRGKVLR